MHELINPLLDVYNPQPLLAWHSKAHLIFHKLRTSVPFYLIYMPNYSCVCVLSLQLDDKPLQAVTFFVSSKGTSSMNTC